MAMVFRSKIDRNLQWLGLALPAIAVLAVATAGHPSRGPTWVPLVATSMAAVVVAWIFLSTYYAFVEDRLEVHAGPFVWRIALREIRSVRRSATVRSGPALSMDRLEIIYGDGRIIVISPADQQGFLTELHLRVPRLKP
jgi:hypothetical protein